MNHGDLQEKEYAKERLERYSGSPADAFCSNLLITNFPRYVDHFAGKYRIESFKGIEILKHAWDDVSQENQLFH